MKLVIDMCLPPGLAEGLATAGHEAVHWSDVGHVRAMDPDILRWARENGYVVLTHDLDFGDLLFASKESGPSVVIIREQDTSPMVILEPVVRVLDRFGQELQEGALIAMGRHMARVRRLPIG